MNALLQSRVVSTFLPRQRGGMPPSISYTQYTMGCSRRDSATLGSWSAPKGGSSQKTEPPESWGASVACMNPDEPGTLLYPRLLRFREFDHVHFRNT